MKIDKAIFLDLDGVLNVEVFINAIYYAAGKTQIDFNRCARDEYGMLFCPTAVNALKHIIEKTGAKIVISSTWRHIGLKLMQEMWVARNLPGEVVGITPSFRNDRTEAEENLSFKDLAERGREIAHYCKENNVANFIIIDDDNDCLPEQEPRFIKTVSRYGLTFEQAEQAIQILNTNNENSSVPAL